MKLETRIKRPASRDSTSFVDRYLNEIIDYGGLPCTRAEAILDMQQMGLTQPMIDRWLQGNELAQRIRERRDRLSVRLTLQPAQSRSRP